MLESGRLGRERELTEGSEFTKERTLETSHDMVKVT